MPRELLMMQNSFQWGTAEGQTLKIENAIRSNIRDLKIEGQTYQNYTDNTKEYVSTESKFNYIYSFSNLKPNTTYTLSYEIKSSNKITTTDKTILFRVEIDKTNSTSGIVAGFTGTVDNIYKQYKLTFNTGSDLLRIKINLRNQFDAPSISLTENTLSVRNLVLLEGDYTNTELPTSINGIESVAEREFEQNLYTDGDLNVKGKVAWYNVKKYVAVKPNTNYTFSCNIESVNKGDHNAKQYIEIYTNEKIPSNVNIILGESGSASFTTNNEAKQLIIYFFVNNEKYSSTECEANFKNIELYENDVYPVKITNRGKNLLDISTFRPISYETIQASKDGNVITVKGLKTSDVEAYTDARACNIKVYLEENKTYSFSFKSDGKYGSAVGTDTVEIFFLLDRTTNKYFKVNGQNTFTIPKGFTGYYYVRFDVNSGDKTHKFWDIQVEEGSVVTDYEPYREPTTTEIPLPQPLRSLPNGVCDEVVDNKLIQRIGKIVATSISIPWAGSLYGVGDDSRLTYVAHGSLNDIKHVSGVNKDLICDKLPVGNLTAENSNYNIMVYGHSATNKELRIAVPKTLLPNGTVEEFKEWLDANPITIYYELATPIEHTINIPPISIAKGTSMVTTNNIKPKLTFKYKQSKKIIKYLYNSGNEYLNITGGWNTQLTAGYGAATTIVKNTNNIYLPSGVWNMLLTNNKIDVTNYDVVYMKYSKEYIYFNGHPARCAIKLGNKNTSWTDFADDATTGTLIGKDETENNVTNGILTIDVSNVTGSYYVGVGGQSNNITVHEIGLKLKKGNSDTTTLYSNGNENTELTGGYLTSSNNSATCNIEKQADNLYVNCTGKQSFDSICYARTNKIIKPCKIKVSAKNNYISANGIAFCMFLSEKEAINSVSEFNSITNKRYIKASNTTQGQYIDLEIDLTDNTEGYFYIACMVAGSADYTCKANIRKIEIIR